VDGAEDVADTWVLSRQTALRLQDVQKTGQPLPVGLHDVKSAQRFQVIALACLSRIRGEAETF